MTKSQCVLRPLALGLLLAPFAPPQADRGPRAEPRRAIAGLVSDANGDPVAGATVTLAGALASPAWRADPDLLRTTTDELGRWRVRARECIEYTAWAAGGGLVSEVASGIVPGPRAELVLRHPPLRSIRIDGLEGWREREPLRARLWLDGGSGHHVEMPIRDGTIELPGEWPYSPFLLELVGADGSSIHVARQAAGTAAAAVAKPREVEILVEGPDGRPSAGAEIYCEQVIPTNLADIGRAWQRFEFVVGRTGVDGRCRARIGTAWQEAEPDHALFLRARKTGFSDTCGGFGWEGRSFAEGLTDEGGPDAPETEAGTLRLRLRPATSVRGHLTDGAVPVVGCPVAVTARRRIATRGGAGYFVATSIVTTTAADGSFV
ncbi:MAG: carboxypeptidase regulatory-like domain-containing protein, partial [Planctomycetes bacterium]|nr:carboxypeptidase regulatory-like domain-containing protein [Planctomycetota bacterium]